MVNIETFKQFALSLAEATEQPHFEKLSFRVNKKIFATTDLRVDRAVLKLSETEQSVFCSFDKSIIYPVKGAWGKQGWTIVELKKIRRDMLKDLVITSYCNVAPKRLSTRYKTQQ